MSTTKRNRYFVSSIIFHILVLMVFVVGFESAAPLAVFENSNKKDVISAVVLGDIATSKILTERTVAPPMPVKEIKEIPKPTVKQKPIPQQVAQIKRDIIELRDAQKKKLMEQKKQAAKKQQELFAKDLLADISKVKKQHKIKQMQLQSHFKDTLRKQAEQSLRQQLLNEEIKLKGSQNRQAQGEVNKYKALILQDISEHWIIPTQADKSLSCQLMIRLAPGGMVLDVQITKSSGDPSLDSSARAAVMKSSPLPVPSDTVAFEAFRQFVLKVKPENIMEAGIS